MGLPPLSQRGGPSPGGADLAMQVALSSLGPEVTCEPLPLDGGLHPMHMHAGPHGGGAWPPWASVSPPGAWDGPAGLWCGEQGPHPCCRKDRAWSPESPQPAHRHCLSESASPPPRPTAKPASPSRGCQRAWSLEHQPEMALRKVSHGSSDMRPRLCGQSAKPVRLAGAPEGQAQGCRSPPWSCHWPRAAASKTRHGRTI